MTGWLFRVARNAITDLFRKKRPTNFSDTSVAVDGDIEGDYQEPQFEDLLPSPDAGPDALYARNLLIEELVAAVSELPEEQRAVFLAHEVEGRSFKEISAATGVSVNTLLSENVTRYCICESGCRGFTTNSRKLEVLDMNRKKRLIFIAPLALLGMALFAFIGGEMVLYLWELAAATTVWLARAQLLAGAWHAGFMPDTVRRLRLPRRRPLPHATAHAGPLREYES